MPLPPTPPDAHLPDSTHPLPARAVTAADTAPPSPGDWYGDPRRAFDTWLALQRFRTSSVLVYRAQWHHFLDWLAARGRDLRTAEPALIDEFAATIDVKRQQRARYLRIMERVFDDMSGQSQAQGNPARAVTRSLDAPWTDTASNAPTGFLDAAERGRLGDELLRRTTTDAQALPWRDLRDRAMAAMLLGAGLKLNELETMRLDQLQLHGPISEPAPTPKDADDAVRWTRAQETDRDGGTVRIERMDAAIASAPSSATAGADATGSRTVPFARQVAIVLARWLRARTENAVEGDLVFPAGRSGMKMHKATALRAVDTLVQCSGLHDTHHGRISPQTLRNAYAAGLFSAGFSDEQVAERLGMLKTLSARRLRAAWDLARGIPTDAAGEGALVTRPSRRRDTA